MRRFVVASVFLAGGMTLGGCAGGPSASYVRGYNSNLDGASQCTALDLPPSVASQPQYLSGCEAASQQWRQEFDNDSGMFGGNNSAQLSPGNPHYKISPIS
jgi:hypothetical protein